MIGCLISAFIIYWGGSNVYHGFLIGPDAVISDGGRCQSHRRPAEEEPDSPNKRRGSGRGFHSGSPCSQEYSTSKGWSGARTGKPLNLASRCTIQILGHFDHACARIFRVRRLLCQDTQHFSCICTRPLERIIPLVEQRQAGGRHWQRAMTTEGDILHNGCRCFWRRIASRE